MKRSHLCLLNAAEDGKKMDCEEVLHEELITIKFTELKKDMNI